MKNNRKNRKLETIRIRNRNPYWREKRITIRKIWHEQVFDGYAKQISFSAVAGRPILNTEYQRWCEEQDKIINEYRRHMKDVKPEDRMKAINDFRCGISYANNK